MYLRERAAHFGVAVNTMHYALKRLKIVKKRKTVSRKMFYEKAELLARVARLIKKRGSENFVYIDETGFKADEVVRPVFRRRIPPLQTTLENKNNAADHTQIICTRHTARW